MKASGRLLLLNSKKVTIRTSFQPLGVLPTAEKSQTCTKYLEEFPFGKHVS